ncbi:MAG: Asp-tRNA(Asn)/Glu-tRNA(Gln) amidotransferase subunit GatC [Acidimicrobiales bacterium]|nr:Asp-tRNA(Asn)/Glu-tRNA(Gln) amidotransferase subunit GatC [Acidimicrobiales bacterium]
MTERITRDDVAHVADLARLSLTADELDAFTLQLADVLDHAADLDALDLSDLEPTAHPFPLVNVFRADVEGPTSDRDEVLAAAPSVEEAQFRVPPVLGEVS